MDWSGLHGLMEHGLVLMEHGLVLMEHGLGSMAWCTPPGMTYPYGTLGTPGTSTGALHEPAMEP